MEIAQSMNKFIAWMEARPKWVKVLLCLPIVDLLWAGWRICKAVKSNDMLKLVIAVIWVVLGGFVLWLLDLAAILINDYPFWWKD